MILYNITQEGLDMNENFNIVQIMMRTIMHYNNIIRQCKKDIEQGKDVDGNKAIIFELQDAIWDVQRRVEFKLGYI